MVVGLRIDRVPKTFPKCHVRGRGFELKFQPAVI